MNLFFSVFQAVFLILSIGILGFFLVSRKVLPESLIRAINPLVLDISLPALIFNTIITGFDPAKIPEWWTLPLWWFVFTIFSLIIIKTTLPVAQHKAEFTVSLLYPNYVFFPLALIPSLFRESTLLLTQLFIFVAFAPPFVFSTFHLFFKKQKKNQTDLKKIINPVLITTLMAILIKISGIDYLIPDVLLRTAKTIGNMALPLIMLVVGGSIYIDFKNRGQLFFKETLIFILLKNFIFPLITLGFLILIRPQFNISVIIFLLSSVPPLTAVSILTKKENGNSSVVNQFIIASFICSTISIPLMILIFHSFMDKN